MIYHECDADLLEHYILKPLGMEEIVIRNPQEIFISFNIILFFVFNFFKIKLFKIKQLRFIYELTLIEIINPKLVVTLIDDDTLFLSFSHYTKKKITFIAIQNGYRAAWNISSLVNNINFKRRLNRFNKEANLYYFSFGKNELDLFEEYLPSLKVVPVGSLRLSVAEKYYPSHNKMYDICLILPIRQFILESYCRDEWSNFYGADHDKISLTIYKTNLKSSSKPQKILLILQ